MVLTLLNHVSPLRGSLAITFANQAGGFCSLGVVAVPQVFAPGAVPNYNGAKYGVTASHCSPVIFATDNATVGQPSASSLDRFGFEVLDAPFFDNSTNTQCPPGRRCRYSDATQIAIDAGVDLAVGTAYNAEASGDPAITGTYNILETFDPFTNFSVRKVGAGSGGTNGTIGQTCQLVNLFEQLPDGSQIDTGNTLLCQTEFNGEAFFGDSGGPVLWTDGNGHLNFLGIIVAGTSHGVNTMSNWNWIWQELYHAGGNVTRLCPVVSPGTDCVFQ